MIETPAKPPKGDPCNRCGYCCSVQPCEIAQEFLGCRSGPCIALEIQNGRTGCGMVRNPLGYLFNATRTEEIHQAPGDPPAVEAASQLSNRIAAALGIGCGCDAEDDESSRGWPATQSTSLWDHP